MQIRATFPFVTNDIQIAFSSRLHLILTFFSLSLFLLLSAHGTDEKYDRIRKICFKEN